MYHLEVLIIKLDVRPRSIGWTIINEWYRFFKYNEDSGKEFCFDQKEFDTLKNWMLRFPQNFDSNTITKYDCKQEQLIIPPITPTISRHIFLHRDNELASKYNLPFKVIGYPI